MMDSRHDSKYLCPDYLVADFDEEKRILHLSCRNKTHPTTKEHLRIKFDAFRELLAKYTATGRIYLIIDMSNFILEPELIKLYAREAKRIRDIYIMPNGIARYGFQITRITVRQSYTQYLGEDPNIFNSRQEAYSYIYSLIEEHKRSGIGIYAPMPAADSAGD